MKLSIFHGLLKNEISVDIFRGTIQNEVEEYEKKLKKKGSSAIIHVDEDYSLYFTAHNLVQLCRHYLDNDLSDSDIYYIADCLTLSESVSFENSELFDLLGEITDPDSNGRLTKGKALLIINRLR